MAVSLRRAIALCSVALAACTTGSGEGSASGLVWAPDCGFEGDLFDLEPDFFAMDPSESVEILDIRIQKGSNFSLVSDGISILVTDAEMVQSDLVGTDIELFRGSPSPNPVPPSVVQMTFYLNDTCDDRSDVPVVYESVSGTIRFDRLFVPWEENETRETIGAFANVEFVDPSDPVERRANLSGDFRFIYARGQPAQPFPR